MAAHTGCSSGAAPEPLRADAVVLAFGDSLTFGKGAAAPDSYPAVLEAMIGRRVVRSGVPGEITEVGLGRLPAVLAETHPDLVILCHGGNDILRRLPAARTRENLREMIRLIKNAGAEVMLVAVPGRSLSLSPPEFYAELADAHDVLLEDEAVRAVLTQPELKSDSVHPNAAGYRLIAARIHERLTRAGVI